MTQAPLFSILTVVRNDSPGLLRTTASVDSQTFADWEHIIVDGASTDGTAELALGLRSAARDVVSEPDTGIYDAMNKAFERARGTLVLYLNAGDSLTSPATLHQVEQSFRRDNWNWAYGQLRYTRNGTPFAVSSHAPFDLQGLRLGTKWLPHQAVYMRSDFSRSIGRYREDIGSAADQELLLRAALESEPHLIFEYLADFEAGGAHDHESARSRELMWHKMRAVNHLLIGNSALLDQAFATARFAGMSSRRAFGMLRRRIAGART